MTNKIKTIPLNALKPSKANIRKTERLAGIESLAASIQASGLLENLVVKPLPSQHGRDAQYEVVAGGRRLAALKLLARKRKLASDEGIPCLVLVNGTTATEASLAENFVRVPAHPADQFEAFAGLIGEGKSADDVAARFGVTPAFVEQRLKLASVSPRLIAEYRSGAMTLEQLTAFTLSDDKALQEQVWFERAYDDLPAPMIRRALTKAHVAASDPRARFVGVKAYEAAGGIVIRDLFDAEDEGYFADGQLLDRLVNEKLAETLQGLRKDGWQWVEAYPLAALADLSRFRRANPTELPLSEDDEARFQKLSQRYDELVSDIEEDEEPPQELETIEREMEEIEQKRLVWTDEDKARCGVIVSLDSDGGVDIARGLVRHDGKGNGSTTEEAPRPKRTGYPDSVLLDLSAHRTVALREMVASLPDVALTALLHALVGRLFFHGAEGSCLTVTVNEVSLERASASVSESKAAQALAVRHQSWAERFPDVEKLWDAISALDASDRSNLLAYCVALSINALEGGVRPQAVQQLADAVRLDMREWWRPSRANFLDRLTKNEILAAVSEGSSQAASWRIASFKKDRMAREAEKILQAAAWLPSSLRAAAIVNSSA